MGHGQGQRWAVGHVSTGYVGAWRRPGHVNVPDPPQWTRVHALGACASVRTAYSAHCVSLTHAHMAAARTVSASACPGVWYSCAPPRGSSMCLISHRSCVVTDSCARCRWAAQAGLHVGPSVPPRRRRHMAHLQGHYTAAPVAEAVHHFSSNRQ